MKISPKQAQVQAKAAQYHLTLSKDSVNEKLPWHLNRNSDGKEIAHVRTLDEVSKAISTYAANIVKVVGYSVGTLYRGQITSHGTLDEARAEMYGYSKEEMQDADDQVILCIVYGDGTELADETYKPQEPKEEAPVEEVKQVKQLLKPQFQPARIDLKKTTSQELKEQVLALLNLQTASQAAKWAKQQGMEVDLCYKSHWAAVLEKAQDSSAVAA
ncbi:hypothetical protein COO91_02009 [Nostoc flagelliforme CCNUN1]|uniref:Uncharacterized protein n=1 Tax=Nostoc flagelliforme CCNUN1 TaxID=2038116 RepID=A0A2K8SL27_9NOSO|nr:hypothetical protein [Nostoc flagelliforme]AUB36108.1 hypothetical protein COO91_02009 [Nostoc flagelliforme CCNUN1]